MRVLFVTPWYPTSDDHLNGIFILQQAQALKRAGCDVVVVSPRPHWLPIPGKSRNHWRQRRRLVPASPAIEAHFPRYWLFPMGIGSTSVGYRCFAGMRRLIMRLHACKPFDVVHCHELLPAGLSTPFLRQYLNLPVVLTLHGVDPIFERGISDPHLSSRLTAVRAATSCVTVVGRPLLSYVSSLGWPTGEINVIPNGVELFTGPISLPPLAQAQLFSRTIVLSVSNLHLTKGVGVNLQAIRLLVDEGFRDLHYVVVGEGPDRTYFEQLARDLNLTDHVTFVGRVSRDETIGWFQACDVFSLPSWREAFGIVYLEAMERGKPVVGCLGQGAEEIIRDGVDGFLVPAQAPASVARVISQLLTDRDAASRMGRSGLQRVMSFTWERNAAEYMALYSSLAGKD